MMEKVAKVSEDTPDSVVFAVQVVSFTSPVAVTELPIKVTLKSLAVAANKVSHTRVSTSPFVA